MKTQARRARREIPPTNSCIAGQFRNANLLDCYAIDLPPGTSSDMRALATTMFESPPAWFRILMLIRDTAIGVFGVKTSNQMRLTTPLKHTIEFFPVQSEDQDEIVLGEDDIHLDFRFSLLRQQTSKGLHLYATTVVLVTAGLAAPTLRSLSPFTTLSCVAVWPAWQGECRLLKLFGPDTVFQHRRMLRLSSASFVEPRSLIEPICLPTW